jgi:trimethylguanosine synthase
MPGSASHQSLLRSITIPHPSPASICTLTFSSKIAAHIGESVPKEKTVIIDAFAGVGGNAIAFARSGRWEQVFAIEKDPKTMKCAKHNAKIYGVDKKIVWVTGDCFDVISRRFAGKDNSVIFASPPWGGKLRIAEGKGRY